MKKSHQEAHFPKRDPDTPNPESGPPSISAGEDRPTINVISSQLIPDQQPRSSSSQRLHVATTYSEPSSGNDIANNVAAILSITGVSSPSLDTIFATVEESATNLGRILSESVVAAHDTPGQQTTVSSTPNDEYASIATMSGERRTATEPIGAVGNDRDAPSTSADDFGLFSPDITTQGSSTDPRSPSIAASCRRIRRVKLRKKSHKANKSAITPSSSLKDFLRLFDKANLSYTISCPEPVRLETKGTQSEGSVTGSSMVVASGGNRENMLSGSDTATIVSLRDTDRGPYRRPSIPSARPDPQVIKGEVNIVLMLNAVPTAQSLADTETQKELPEWGAQDEASEFPITYGDLVSHTILETDASEEEGLETERLGPERVALEFIPDSEPTGPLQADDDDVLELVRFLNRTISSHVKDEAIEVTSQELSPVGVQPRRVGDRVHEESKKKEREFGAGTQEGYVVSPTEPRKTRTVRRPGATMETTVDSEPLLSLTELDAALKEKSQTSSMGPYATVPTYDEKAVESVLSLEGRRRPVDEIHLAEVGSGRERTTEDETFFSFEADAIYRLPKIELIVRKLGDADLKDFESSDIKEGVALKHKPEAEPEGEIGVPDSPRKDQATPSSSWIEEFFQTPGKKRQTVSDQTASSAIATKSEEMARKDHLAEVLDEAWPMLPSTASHIVSQPPRAEIMEKAASTFPPTIDTEEQLQQGLPSVVAHSVYRPPLVPADEEVIIEPAVTEVTVGEEKRKRPGEAIVTPEISAPTPALTDVLQSDVVKAVERRAPRPQYVGEVGPLLPSMVAHSCWQPAVSHAEEIKLTAEVTGAASEAAMALLPGDVVKTPEITEAAEEEPILPSAAALKYWQEPVFEADGTALMSAVTGARPEVSAVLPVGLAEGSEQGPLLRTETIAEVEERPMLPSMAAQRVSEPVVPELKGGYEPERQFKAPPTGTQGMVDELGEIQPAVVADGKLKPPYGEVRRESTEPSAAGAMEETLRSVLLTVDVQRVWQPPTRTTSDRRPTFPSMVGHSAGQRLAQRVTGETALSQEAAPLDEAHPMLPSVAGQEIWGRSTAEDGGSIDDQHLAADYGEERLRAALLSVVVRRTWCPPATCASSAAPVDEAQSLSPGESVTAPSKPTEASATEETHTLPGTATPSVQRLPATRTRENAAEGAPQSVVESLRSVLLSVVIRRPWKPPYLPSQEPAEPCRILPSMVAHRMWHRAPSAATGVYVLEAPVSSASSQEIGHVPDKEGSAHSLEIIQPVRDEAVSVPTLLGAKPIEEKLRSFLLDVAVKRVRQPPTEAGPIFSEATAEEVRPMFPSMVAHEVRTTRVTTVEEILAAALREELRQVLPSMALPSEVVTAAGEEKKLITTEVREGGFAFEPALAEPVVTPSTASEALRPPTTEGFRPVPAGTLEKVAPPVRPGEVITGNEVNFRPTIPYPVQNSQQSAINQCPTAWYIDETLTAFQRVAVCGRQIGWVYDACRVLGCHAILRCP